MDLLDRYLQAVRLWLPRAQKNDIIAELSEDLHAQIEDQQTALGRPLTDDEVDALLRRVGRPVVVANRYLPQRYLIGPAWFPIYAFVMKIVMACYLVPWILVWAGLMIFDPAYRAHHVAAGWIQAVGDAWGGFWVATTIAIGTVTLVFAVLERVEGKSRILENWSPRHLPAVRDRRRIPRLASVIEIVANVVFISWWVPAMRSPLVLDRPQVRILLAPEWTTFFAGFLILAIVNIVASSTNLLHPYWTRMRASMRLITDAGSVALFLGLCRANIIASITVPDTSSERTAQLAATINHVASQVWPVVLGVGLIVIGADIYRILRAGETDGRLVPDGGMPNHASR